ncbi:MAG: 16S rRNA methyltransferase [Promethearchaeia archaeon]
MPLILLLVECSLEIIPRKIRSHPAVQRNLNDKNYMSQLLDNALHHSAMSNLKNRQKRGRPDITHLCLLNALGSTLNKSGNLRIFIHTYRGKIFEVSPEVRIARNFNRFKGLIAKLLIDGEIRIKNGFLFKRFRGSLEKLIQSFKDPKVSLLTETGQQIEHPLEFYDSNLEKNQILFIGGFQKDKFSEKILQLSRNHISISQYSLDAWVAVNKMITYYELTFNIY